MGLLATESPRAVGLNCYLCGTAFWIERNIYDRRMEDGRNFWCPNGHDQHFTELEATKLKRQLEQKNHEIESLKRSRDWAQSRTKGANIAAGKAKAQLRRTLERVHAGVCPHCQRTFKQLAAHMKSKHGAAST